MIQISSRYHVDHVDSIISSYSDHVFLYLKRVLRRDVMASNPVQRTRFIDKRKNKSSYLFFVTSAKTSESLQAQNA